MSEATPPAEGRRFPETQWSRLLAAANGGDPQHRELLSRLLERYWRPTYHYIRAVRPLSREDAEDLTQGFFTMVLTRVDLAALSPERGSFRGFLKTALRRFVISHDRGQAARRGRDAAYARFDWAAAEASFRPGSGPEEAFDHAWARGVLDEMLARLKDELLAEGKAVPYELFRRYCVDPTEGEPPSYADLAAAHGIKEDDVRNHLRAVRKRARALLRTLAREYLLPGESLEDELRFLLGA